MMKGCSAEWKMQLLSLKDAQSLRVRKEMMQRRVAE